MDRSTLPISINLAPDVRTIGPRYQLRLTY
jgi:hypothetical protein